MTTKHCSRCGQEKSIYNFRHVPSRNSRHAWCADCESEAAVERQRSSQESTSMSRSRPIAPPTNQGVFDRIAERASMTASRAPFFAFCVLAVVMWAPSWFLLRDLDLWQLIINTFTTIVTFLMVALLQNSDARANRAAQFKIDTIAYGVRDLMDHVNHVMPCENDDCDFADDIDKLETAIGIEEEVGTKE